jgi:hypothetical protein
MSARSHSSQEKAHLDSAVVGRPLNRQLTQDGTGRGGTLRGAASQGDFHHSLLVGEAEGKSGFLFVFTSSEKRGSRAWVAFTFCRHLH